MKKAIGFLWFISEPQQHIHNAGQKLRESGRKVYFKAKFI